ncbi:MAG: hypothetical protein U0807_07925 [Candidatus Binatia bacterium]
MPEGFSQAIAFALGVGVWGLPLFAWLSFVATRPPHPPWSGLAASARILLLAIACPATLLAAAAVGAAVHSGQLADGGGWLLLMGVVGWGALWALDHQRRTAAPRA